MAASRTGKQKADEYTLLYHYLHQKTVPLPPSERACGTSDHDHLQPQGLVRPQREILKIIHKIRHPSSILALLDCYGHRKDYKPNKALYALAIDRLAMTDMFDYVEGVMQRISAEKACRLSDEFFYDLIKVYGNVVGRVYRAVEAL